MKAFALDALDTPPATRDDLPEPSAEGKQVIVRVHASSVNPVDAAIAGGMLAQMFEHEFPVTLGRDYAGVVEEVGAEVTRYAVGDEVFGFVPHVNPTVHDGSWAELIAVPEDTSIAPAPAGVDVATAGAAPLAAIAAIASIDALQVAEGDTVLIVGASGGVGSFAVQLATDAGATVIAPGRAEDEEYLRGLGVTELVDREADIAAAVRERHPDGVDALLDLVSYAPGAFDGVLGDGARVASPNGAAGEGPGRTNVMATPSTDNLERVAQLLDNGTLEVSIQDTYELARVGEALEALGTTHTRGKLAIRVD
jgi:NADPH:quinone reductase